MENLSLRARRHEQHNDSYKYYSPRLPTPEESSCGRRSFEDESSGERAAVPMSNGDHLMRATRRTDASQLDTTDRRPYSRGENRHRSRPDSPPYQPSDMHKPSLPPLKTVRRNQQTSRTLCASTDVCLGPCKRYVESPWQSPIHVLVVDTAVTSGTSLHGCNLQTAITLSS